MHRIKRRRVNADRNENRFVTNHNKIVTKINAHIGNRECLSARIVDLVWLPEYSLEWRDCVQWSESVRSLGPAEGRGARYDVPDTSGGRGDSVVAALEAV